MPCQTSLRQLANRLYVVAVDLDTGESVKFGAPGYVDPAVGVRALDVPQGRIDGSMGDVHPYGNPHYWFTPENVEIAVRNIADGLIQAGKSKNVLLIGAEFLTRYTDYTDRATCVLFGDGAGAVVMEACESGDGVLGTYIKSDGSYAELLYLPGGGSRRPLTEERLRNREQYVKMKGDGLFKYAVRAMVEASEAVLRQAGLTTADIDFLVPHQANLRIIEGVRSRLHVPPEKAIVNIDRVGNTSSASIPIALGEARDKGLIKRGDRIVMVAFGGGLTWGALLLKY